MLNKMGWHQCPKIVEQKKGDVDGPLECRLALEWWQRKRVVAWLLGRREAAFHQLVLMTPQNSSACKQPETVNFLLGGQEKLTANDPGHVLQKNGGLVDLWYMDDVDIPLHPILFPSFQHEFDVANTKVRPERNPQKTEVIYNVNELDAAPLEWMIRNVQNMSRVSTVTAGSITLGISVGPRQFFGDQLLGKADVIRAMHERVQFYKDPQTEFAFLRESLGVSRINHILRVHGHTILQEQRAAEVCDEVGQRSLERLFPGFTEDRKNASNTQPWPVGNRVQKSARHRGSSTPGNPHSSQAAHPSNDPGWSHSWSSAEAILGNSLGRSH